MLYIGVAIIGAITGGIGGAILFPLILGIIHLVLLAIVDN